METPLQKHDYLRQDQNVNPPLEKFRLHGITGITTVMLSFIMV